MPDDFAKLAKMLEQKFEVHLGEAGRRALRKWGMETVEIDEDDRAGDGVKLEKAFGLISLDFERQHFYSIKFSNLGRNRAAAARVGGQLASGAVQGGVAGAVVQGIGGTSLLSAMQQGTFWAWPGAAAGLALLLSVYGVRETFKTPLNYEHATALALAWRHKHDDGGFHLVEEAELVSRLGEAETDFNHRGFSADKLANALRDLAAFGVIKEAGKGRWQLIEKIKRTV